MARDLQRSTYRGDAISTFWDQAEPYARLNDTRGNVERYALLERAHGAPAALRRREVVQRWPDENQAAMPQTASAEMIEEFKDDRIAEQIGRASDVSAPFAFHPLQEWEGYVLKVDRDTFTARLTDVSAGETRAGEEAILPIDDLSDDDRKMLESGRLFRWCIGYQRTHGGTKRRVSQIVFRRLPKWTAKDIAQAKGEGERLARSLNWE